MEDWISIIFDEGARFLTGGFFARDGVKSIITVKPKELSMDIVIDDEQQPVIETELSLGRLLFEDKYKKIYVSDLRDFIPNIYIYSGQRPLCEEHVNKLVKCLYDDDTDFKGTMKVVFCRKEKKIYLIDGMHRVNAYKKIMENDSKFNRNILIECYETEDVNSEQTISLFKAVNNCKNIELTELPVIDAIVIVEMICKQFPKMISETDKTRTNRPKLSKQDLTTHVRIILQNSNKSKEEIFELILSKNREYGLKSIDKFKKISPAMLKKCKDSGFYLGLDDNFQWIKEIM